MGLQGTKATDLALHQGAGLVLGLLLELVGAKPLLLLAKSITGSRYNPGPQVAPAQLDPG